jgi:predicted GNAT family N-acyltransferase
MASYAVEVVEWHACRHQLMAVRREVFVQEQRVPEALEWDGADARCRHVLATAGDGTPIGTARLDPEGRIGRMAVIRPWRRSGVGSALLAALIDLARADRLPRVRLHAQIHALEFYARFGFVPAGAEFQEAGIAHRAMELTLAQEPQGGSQASMRI